MTGLFSEINLQKIDLSKNELISVQVFWRCIQDLQAFGYLFPGLAQHKQLPTYMCLKFQQNLSMPMETTDNNK